MKSLLIAGLLFISSSAHATYSDASMLAYVLNLPEVLQELDNSSIKNVKFEKKTEGTTWTYFISITNIRGELNPKEKVQTCLSLIQITTVGGVVSTDISEPSIERICK